MKGEFTIPMISFRYCFLASLLALTLFAPSCNKNKETGKMNNSMIVNKNRYYSLSIMAYKPIMTQAEVDTMLALRNNDLAIKTSVAKDMLKSLESLDEDSVLRNIDLNELGYTTLGIGTFCTTPEECKEMLQKNLRAFKSYLAEDDLTDHRLSREYFYYSQSKALRTFWYRKPRYLFTLEFWEACFESSPVFERYFTLDTTPFDFYLQDIFDPMETNPMLEVSNLQAAQLLEALQANAEILKSFPDYGILESLLKRQGKGEVRIVVTFGD